MFLPQIQTTDSDLLKAALLQWRNVLNPVLDNPLLQGRLLQNVALTSGANVVNHGLARPLQGWLLTRLRSSASVYDTQDSNPRPALTLQLVTSADVSADIYVF